MHVSAQGDTFREGSPQPRRQRVELAKLRMHYEGANTQLRLKGDDALVARYAYEMARGDRFPPIEVVAVGDGTFYIVDGWHRAAAASGAQGRQRNPSIAAIVHTTPEGMQPIDYAVRLALRANRTHGLMLTRGDQERRAAVALKLPEYQGLTASALEREIGASRMTIARAHAKLLASGELPEWQTGKPLPPCVPLEYASLHRKGTRGHPLCWDRELRDEVFAFVGQLEAFAPKEWSYRFAGEDQANMDEEVESPDHWAGYVEHHGLMPDRAVIFDPFPPNRVVKGMPKLRQVVDPNAVFTDEQRKRIERAKREREINDAWKRIEGHINRAVPQAARTIVEHAERDRGFAADLWRVLPAEPTEF